VIKPKIIIHIEYAEDINSYRCKISSVLDPNMFQESIQDSYIDAMKWCDATILAPPQSQAEPLLDTSTKP
jgi:hypothetical protein